MRFIIIDDKKLIIFWSPKCGCSTLKTILAIYYDIDNKNKYKSIHKNKELSAKINKKDKNKIDIYKNYDIVMLIRNPYERLISGFLNKYVNGKIKNPPNCICFYDFCQILQKNPRQIDRHHFEKQTTGQGWKFYNELQRPKIKYVLDTSKVNDITKILGLNISEIKLNSSKKSIKKDEKMKQRNLWSLNYNSLRNSNELCYSNFYNDHISKIVYNIYKDDFIFFNNDLNMNYTILE